MAIFRDGDPKAETYSFMSQYTSFLKPMTRKLIGREKEMQQLMAAMQRPELCNVILLAPAGSGKALADDTPIPVADDRGYVNIGDLCEGDYVFDQNGVPTKVLGVFHQGEIDAYEVVFTDKTSIVCNDEHIWAARKYHEHKEDNFYHEITLREMMDFGITKTVTRNRNGENKDFVAKCWYVPICEPVDRPTHDYKIHPYVMGVLIGDGCLTDRPLSLSSKDDEIVYHVAELLGATDYHQSAYNYSWVFEDGNNLWARSDSSFARKYIQTKDLAVCGNYDCVFGTTADKKRIPRDYFLGSVEQRFALLQGLMDTDGCIVNDNRANCNFATTSFGLAQDVIELANSLGIRATMTESSRQRENRSSEYSVHFSIEPKRKKDLFYLSRKKMIAVKHETYYEEKRTFRKIYDDMSIDSVNDLHKKVSMTCIYVDSPDHLYIAGKNHIVTHNTALVQGTMAKDKSRAYLEVDLPRMISNLKNENEMADKLKRLFSEVARYRKAENKEIVLFIDEFHQIVQLSPAAVEVLKPLLADSGTRGIRVIAATTYVEYNMYISANQPLVERLQRINLKEPGKDVVVSILRGMAETYNVSNQFRTDAMFESIYEYTNRYIPANSQPRKSILMMDSMIGWHRLTGNPIDIKMLADVIYDSEGVNIAFRVDATKIKKTLDENVIAQDYATTAIASRLQICCADLNNKERPMSSFLFTGSTGVGKSQDVDTIIPVYTTSGGVSHKRAGDVQVGDYVFDRLGNPTKVLGVFPQGKMDVYRVTLGDGRSVDVSGNHLWAVYPAKRSRNEGYTIYTTETLLEKGLVTRYHGREGMKYFIPMNGAVAWSEKDYAVSPYVIGAAIGNGLLTSNDAFQISSQDEFVVSKIADLIGAVRYEKDNSSYSWHFYKDADSCRRVQLVDICGCLPEIYHKYSGERRIPVNYMTGSISQRWELIQGLFDTDGTICASDGERYNVSYSTFSKNLAYDIQELLYSLGVSSTVSCHVRDKVDDAGNVRHMEEYDVHVCSKNADKYKYFSLPRKVDIARKATGVNKQREKTFDYVGIRAIEHLSYQKDMVCFYVDNYEHLYQTGSYIVTHNTETCKQLAKILFEDQRSLIRMDMTEYSDPRSLERFRLELTESVWQRPYCIILLDEIEKACAEVTRILLQVLDDGRLLNKNNRETTFKNAYIIVTTNAGSEIYKTIAQYAVDDMGSGKILEKYEALIKESIKGTTGDGKFPPELLGRIDCIVPFQPLSESTMAKICMMKLYKLAEEVKRKHHLDVAYDRKIFRYIVQDKMTTDSDAGGARGVVSRIDKEVTTAIATYINDHPGFRDGRTIFVQIKGELMIDNKTQLESNASVVVSDKPLPTFEAIVTQN